VLISLEVLRARQREVHEIASTLRAMLTVDEARVAPVATVIRRMLGELCRTAKAYIAEEDEELYAVLMSQSVNEIRDLAWGFRSAGRPLCREFERYACRWLDEDDLRVTPEFMNETLELLDAIEKRIEREQQIMIPQLEEYGVFRTQAL